MIGFWEVYLGSSKAITGGELPCKDLTFAYIPFIYALHKLPAFSLS